MRNYPRENILRSLSAVFLPSSFFSFRKIRFKPQLEEMTGDSFAVVTCHAVKAMKRLLKLFDFLLQIYLL